MGKALTLQLKNSDGTIEDESQLILHEGDCIIMKYSNELSQETVHKAFKGLSKALESNAILLAIPKGIELQVLSKC